MITTNLSTLKIHTLTQEQYDRELEVGNIDENALYLTPNNAMNSVNPTATGSLSVNRYPDSYIGYNSVALNSNTTASGTGSLAVGNGTISEGEHSFSEGEGTTASGAGSHSMGCGTEAIGIYSLAGGAYTIAKDYQSVFGKYNNETNCIQYPEDQSNDDAIFLVGCGTYSANQNAFRVASGGKCYGSSTFGASGADFAELFEWDDGNPNDEDRRGLFVSLNNDKIKLANGDDDYIGIISGAQAFIGNSASEEWQGKYLKDIFGAKLMQRVEIPEMKDEKTGEIVPQHTVTQYILNPDYNPNEEYIMRENRKEWGIVGLLGQVVVIDDGTCKVGSYCKPSTNGIGTASDSGYRVMKRIDENHIKVLVK